MKKTYLIIVSVDKFATNDSYKNIEQHWEIPVTIKSSSRKAALNDSHSVALALAQLDYGTSLGSWRTSIYKVDQVACTPEKIND